VLVQIKGSRGESIAGEDGPPAELDALFLRVYDQLRRMAAALMRSQPPDHTLQPTSLVHEAYLKLSRHDELAGIDRAHVLALAARAMRQILVDHARAHRRDKRGGGRLRVTLAEGMAAAAPAWDVIALDQALGRLAQLDPQQVRIVELRFLAGLSVEEVAELLGISTATVKRDTAVARAWLFRELRQATAGRER
jgi:RNA polymerase sigma-70 factor, ECF subfamily